MAGKKLLVADDSLTIQKVIRLALSNEGYDIQAVSDGNDAIQQISLFRPDLVLIDVSLPGKSAFEVKRTINQQGDFQDVRFVLMSSAFEKVDEDQATQVVFHGRLTKPFDPAHLRQVLSDVLVTHGEPTRGFEPLSPLSSEDPVEPPPGFDEAAIAPPPAPGSHGEDSLWEPEEKQKMDDPFANLTPPPMPGASAPDSDIRHLTESTIRMSGLDDFNWSINETARKEPTLPPHAALGDLSGATFKFSEEDKTDVNEIVHGSPTPEPSHSPIPPPPSFGAGATSSNANLTGLSASQMEAVIKSQLQDTLEKMVQKILPEVAERVIKQEIHRMLQETP
jgi:CheY-like chemotaxis protein